MVLLVPPANAENIAVVSVIRQELNTVFLVVEQEVQYMKSHAVVRS